MSIFKAYDIRGIYGAELTQDDFYKIARAYAQFCGFTGKGRVVVARDCRKSSDALFAAFSQGLVDEGVDVIDIGLASTPMSYFANAKLGADGSVTFETDGFSVYVDGRFRGRNAKAVSHVPEFVLISTECKWYRSNRMTGTGVPELEAAALAGDDFVVDHVRVYDVVK